VFLGKLSNNDNEPRKIKPQPKLPSALRRHTATCASHGNRVTVIRVGLRYSVVRITERASLFEILWVMKVLRFIRTVSDIRAGLHGAGRVLGGVLCSSGH
jgi:hypothetical protein